MKLKTFRIGGIHPDDNKISSEAAVEMLPLPAVAYISMAQHLGAPATPIVQKGDKVLVGQVTEYLRALMSARMNNDDDAAEALRKAIQKDPSFAKYAENDIELKKIQK